MAREKEIMNEEVMETTEEVFDAAEEAIVIAEEVEPGKLKKFVSGAWTFTKKIFPYVAAFGGGIAVGKKMGVKPSDVVEVTKEVIDDVEVINF